MPRRPFRVLALVCGLVLALPPGWCCLLAAPKAPVRAAAPTCDGCCCCCRVAHPPADPPAPPRGPFAKGCCCADRNATKPAGPEMIAPCPAPDLLAVPPAAAPAPAHLGPVLVADRPDLHSPPANLLHCVWLC
jgi:hypothetical protein